jgi:hypothetical protein
LRYESPGLLLGHVFLPFIDVTTYLDSGTPSQKASVFSAASISDMGLLENVAKTFGVSFPNKHSHGKKVYKT